MIKLKVNRKPQSVDVNPDTPLLWVLRENLGLTGTKYGCGMALCGACTVHLDGEAVRSCVTPVSRAADKEVTTIEGLSSDLSHPLQRAWIAQDVPVRILPVGPDHVGRRPAPRKRAPDRRRHR